MIWYWIACIIISFLIHYKYLNNKKFHVITPKQKLNPKRELRGNIKNNIIIDKNKFLKQIRNWKSKRMINELRFKYILHNDGRIEVKGMNIHNQSFLDDAVYCGSHIYLFFNRDNVDEYGRLIKSEPYVKMSN